MGKQGIHFMIAATAVAGAIHVLAWLVDSCSRTIITKALIDGTAASCGEFWLNRYQSMIAGLVALLGAWLTIRTMRHQTAVSRADDADRRLSRYVAAVKNMMSALQDVDQPHPDNSDFDRCFKTLEAYEKVADDASISEAMADGILGEDARMLAFLKNTADKRASGLVFGRDTTSEAMVLDPLCFALLESFNRRQDRLRRGATVEELRAIVLIDRGEVYRSIQEKRPPILD
jgi:hypothetical protein